MQAALEASLYQLVLRTVTELPFDVYSFLNFFAQQESSQSLASSLFQQVFKNVSLATERKRPLCQDTGYPCFLIQAPYEWKTPIERAISVTLERCLEDGVLRANALDPVTSQNLGTLGPMFPSVLYEESQEICVRLLLKGGGSENQSAQFALPHLEFGADRSLEGVFRTVMHAVHRIQGQGCAPGALSIVLGGDRSIGMAVAKRAFFDVWSAPATGSVEPLQALAERILESANSLGIGPMGLGGRTTLYAVRCLGLARHPASFFVSIGYMCWAWRRQGIYLNAQGEIVRWLV